MEVTSHRAIENPAETTCSQPQNEPVAITKDRPILFSGAMVHAILEGRKTQTRRVIKFARVPYEPDSHNVWKCWNGSPSKGNWSHQWQDGDLVLRCPYGKPGDRLWVRETFIPDPPIDGWSGDISWNGCGRPISGVPEHYRSPEHCIFRASWDGSDLKWRPGIHMPRWASRLTLQITKIRAERVQQITNEDAQAEGCDFRISKTPNYANAFAILWDSINAKRGFSWEVNPWVWVVEFRRIP